MTGVDVESQVVAPDDPEIVQTMIPPGAGPPGFEFTVAVKVMFWPRVGAAGVFRNEMVGNSGPTTMLVRPA